MAALAHRIDFPAIAARPPLADRMRRRLLWLVGFSGFFVVVEPAPYEAVIALAMVVFATTGLVLRPAHLPLAALLILYCLACAASLIPVMAETKPLTWTIVSVYLAATSLFFSMALVEDTEKRIGALMNGYIIGAVLSAAIAFLTYFRVIPAPDAAIDLQRAAATFKNPNVFGPFLILPSLLMAQRVLLGRPRESLISGATLLLISGAILLSFSRGAWAHFAVSMTLMLLLVFLASGSAKLRLRILLVGVVGGLLIAALIIALLSINQVADLFQDRATLMKDYDSGHTGRFGRHIIGALMIFDHPNGIGPLQFAKYLPEDPHNSFLDAFMAGGWIGGFCWLALMLLTLIIGFKYVFMATPWQAIYIAIYATYVGEFLESYIIDVQHWRHYYLILGAIWGLIIAANSSLRRQPGRTAAPSSALTGL